MTQTQHSLIARMGHDQIADHFWSKVARGGSDECWPWKGCVHKGYGVFTTPGLSTSRRAHRIAWELDNGRPLPEGMVACHSCDNPGCVNPAHIWPGTNADNTADMVRKGRTRRESTTHCRNGHEYTPENTILNRKDRGWRCCRICRLETKRRSRMRKAGVL